MNTFVIVLCWLLSAFYLWGASLAVLNIGKERKPSTPGVVLTALVLTGLLVFTLIFSALHL